MSIKDSILFLFQDRKCGIWRVTWWPHREWTYYTWPWTPSSPSSSWVHDHEHKHGKYRSWDMIMITVMIHTQLSCWELQNWKVVEDNYWRIRDKPAWLNNIKTVLQHTESRLLRSIYPCLNCVGILICLYESLLLEV